MEAPPPITGHAAADARLRRLAERRGYRDQSIAVVAKMHDDVTLAVDRLIAAAAGDGVVLRVTSGFRSISAQRGIVLDKLDRFCIDWRGSRCDPDLLASGAADPVIEEVLAVSSLPGHSSHHTGWVIDLGDDTEPFIEPGTPGYEWLTADDDANARRFGFAPRYPIGGPPIGPDPEPWEWFYAGRDDLAPFGNDVAS
jgi:LAS superfamily LD-carboxypeptidase LdcB